MKVVFYVEFDRGAFLVEARNASTAKKWAEHEFGRDGAPYRVRKATDDDRRWVTGMGGRIHEA